MASKGGKGARKRRKARRDSEKRKRKAAQKALYMARVATGDNSKRKNRQKRKGLRRALSTVSHPVGRCGNLGCVECHGLNFRPFLNKHGVPEGMPHWMFKKFTPGQSYLSPTRI